jgi:hypothetical protein
MARTRKGDLPDGTRDFRNRGAGCVHRLESSSEIRLTARYFGPEHPALHAADAVLHSATHAPDKPQFMAQEKPLESQRETHSASV